MKRYIRTISYALSLIAVAGIFLGMEFGIEKYICPNDELVDIIAAIAGALSFSECRVIFDRATERIFLRVKRDIHAEIISTISHELQTPIAIVRCNMEMLHQAGMSDKEREHSERIIIKTLDSMSRLVGSMLESAKLTFSKKTLHKKEFSMRSLLKEIHEDVRLLAREKEITFSVGINEDYFIHADRDRLREVLLNLISNALKHTPAGGSIMMLGKRLGTNASIVVEDSGCGIAPQELPYIFERFYRINSDMPGTGIGLDLCRTIIESHGGTIGVESVIGEGSRFTIHLPLAG